MLTRPEEIARKAPPGNCRRLYDGSAVEYCPDADPVAECKQLAVDYLHANLTKRALKEIPSLTWRIVQECFWRECNRNQWCGDVDGVDVCLADMNVLVILNFSCGEMLLVSLKISKLLSGPPCESTVCF